MKLANKRKILLFLAVIFAVFTVVPAEVIKADETINSEGISLESSESRSIDVISYAKRFLGYPYRYGAAGPDAFDCSGFTQYVYRNAAGIEIGRTTYNQISAGKEVSYSELQPGDLVFAHESHVGIYVGNGQMIHSPRTGDVVKIAPVYQFWRARRIIQNTPAAPEPEKPSAPETGKPNTPSVPETEVPDIVGQAVTVQRAAGDAAGIVCNSDFYRRKYADLNNAFGTNYNALFNHFMSCGIAEGRSASEVFDPVYYLNSNEDLQRAFGKKNYKAAYNHFLTYGYAENRDLSPLFNMAYYSQNNPDVKKAFGNNYYAIMRHFLTYGMSEGRASSPNFNFNTYKSNYVDLRNAYGNNNSLYYDHYLIYGKDEGRRAV